MTGRAADRDRMAVQIDRQVGWWNEEHDGLGHGFHDATRHEHCEGMGRKCKPAYVKDMADTSDIEGVLHRGGRLVAGDKTMEKLHISALVDVIRPALMTTHSVTQDEWPDAAAKAIIARLLANPATVRRALMAECDHPSLSGIDVTPADDPAKVWRCHSCGWEGTRP